MTTSPHAALIDALGGPVKVAELLGMDDYHVVSNWRSRGVSWQWRAAVAELARARRIKLPAGFLRPARDRAA